MIREAESEGLPEGEGHLARQIDLAMFPPGTLRTHGLGRASLSRDAPHAVRVRPVGGKGLVALAPSGVDLPPAVRGGRHARLAVARLLAKARAAGDTRAGLFAAGWTAARACRAIGLRSNDSFALVLFAAPVRLAV